MHKVAQVKTKNNNMGDKLLFCQFCY